MTSYTCPYHNTEQDTYCPQCLEDYKALPDPATMTGEERVAEMRRWNDILTIPFGDLHARIEALVGRSVWTHEMAGSERFELLVEESRTRPGTVDIAAVIEKLGDPESTTVVVVPT